MIINTGMRTDIPAFYSKWFLNRIKEGYVYVRNPYNKSAVTKYILDPKVVDCLAFCTKNPHPLIKHLDELKKYNQFWFVTITPYLKDLEPNVPDKRQVIEDFKILSKTLGKHSVALRYDPIIITEKYSVEYHIKCFEKLLESLKGYTEDCTISFVDLYDKLKKNAPEIKEVSKEDQIKIAKAFKEIGDKNNIVIHGCCEKEDLKDYGIDITGCMSKEIVEKAVKRKLVVPKQNIKREGCSCLLGNDIGAYNTCMHLCKYCYANYSKALVKLNYLKHDENSPMIIGNVNNGDIIKTANQQSYIEKQGQICFLD